MTLPCGCVLRNIYVHPSYGKDGGLEIDFCPLHKHAEEMRNLLKEMCRIKYNENIFDLVDKAHDLIKLT